ncbi:AI-2E family transporter [uncultured archaeon]|nr:AI-2E family transporter [uncultured archaeon]
MVEMQLVNKIIVFFLIASLFVAGFFILKPIILSIFIGILLAYILQPLYAPIKRRIKSPNISVSLFLIIIVIVIAVPLWFFLPTFIREIFDSYLYIQKIDIASAVGKIVSFFLSDETARVFSTQINVAIAKFFSFSLASSGAGLSNFGDILIQVSVVFFTLYFGLRDSHKFGAYFAELSPFSKSTGEKFSKEFRNITNSIVFGQVATGVIQGLCLGLALWLLGIPKFIFLTVIAIIVSIIPIIGAWLIWLPTSLILIVSGSVSKGIILFFYGLLFVSTIDNILRPFFISRQSNINIFIAILGTIGGLYVFGFIGVIIGPLILSYLIIIIEFYRQGKLNELFRD